VEARASALVSTVVRYHQAMRGNTVVLSHQAMSGNTVVRYRQAMRGSAVTSYHQQAMGGHDALIGKDLFNRHYYAQRDMVQQIVESARNKYEFLLFVVKAVTSTVFATRSTSLGGCACKGEGCVRGCGVMWCCALLVRVTQLDIQ